VTIVFRVDSIDYSFSLFFFELDNIVHPFLTLVLHVHLLLSILFGSATF